MAETPVPAVVTPRRTRLVRAAGLRSWQRAIVENAFSTAALEDLRSRCVVVPTHAAAAALRRTMEDARLGGRRSAAGAVEATTLPQIVTRAELYAVLYERTASVPAALSAFEREALLRRAARDVAAGGMPPPFRLRPGLLVEMLRFYDELRRRRKTIDDFDRLLTGDLASYAEYDRGAERLLRQTRFLAAAFRAYEARAAHSGGSDEHTMRRILLERAAQRPIAHVIVTTGDEIADAGGLWPADFDLLSRMPGLARLDVIVTEEQLAGGLHQRLHDLLPGLEEATVQDVLAPAPILMAPDGRDAPLYFTERDREEELVAVARMLKARRAAPGRFAVVFQRPLPYLYLARQVFGSAGIGYDAVDALPLAAEPFAAAIDVLFTCLVADYTRASLVELLRLPQFAFDENGKRPGASAVAALDRLLLEAKHLGGLDSLAEVQHHRRATAATRTLLDTLLRIGAELETIRRADRASVQIDALLRFIRRHERMPAASAPWRERHLRARAAVLATLESLRDAHAAHDDEAVDLPELAAAVRRWIEEQTFAPRTGQGGVHLVDADAARYAEYDELRIVGLVEGDWPMRAGRNIFYPASLLTQLGWPAEPARLAAARSAFRDLLRLASRRVSVSAHNLEDDALVAPSTFVEELESAGLTVERPPAPEPSRIFVHEALAMDPVVPVVNGEAAEWLALRMAPDAGPDDRYRGAAGPQPADTYAISHLERYLECPFKYFAAFVLKLEEEREEEAGMSPTERGQFLHDLLMQFFERWQEAGHGAITADNAADALAAFRALAAERLATLAPMDRALEDARLLGSAAVPGLAERLFAFEIERETPVIERLLEHPLEGEFAFTAGDRERAIRLRAKADRIDLLADGTLRIIDYKLRRAPRMSRALQLPIYGVCAAQHLEGRHGRSWSVGEAGYVAFGDPEVFKSLAGRTSSLDDALATGQARLLDAVEGIERGEFPPRPDEPYLCTFCAYSGVCRKDYVGDE